MPSSSQECHLPPKSVIFLPAALLCCNAFGYPAQNSEGNDILGVSANDRVSSYTDLMREDRISRQNPLRHPTRSLDWPAWAAMAAAAAGLIRASVAIYSDKVRHGLTCTFCMKKEDDNTEEADSVTLE